MQRSLLSSTNPEFSALRFPTFTEFKVENWRLSRDGTGKIVKGSSSWSWPDCIPPVIVAYLWPKTSLWARITIIMLVAVLVWLKCTQVLFESVVVFPDHGIQLETHRGLPPWTFSVSRRFIPKATLRDVVINEGITRWNIRYYLLAINQRKPDVVDIELFFPNILPHFPVLQEVYCGVHDILFRA
ncbi:hypothetical protein E1B28_004461 [Marasmius oreades]|uniref:Phosphatidylinositol N-acetylglucosaminyltransferase subunit H conserved domain-containing protein n=1 Tax=Marasmius oreades TaxID=181124 RepID=A0A9P7UYK7_9AGAR|nr:uncharacterized protein E1B28_004461 [Marasmius oreades]KAG7097075.1 hypothetical protein E1B28_004461 [Marasmius oreades]